MALTMQKLCKFIAKRNMSSFRSNFQFDSDLQSCNIKLSDLGKLTHYRVPPYTDKDGHARIGPIDSYTWDLPDYWPFRGFRLLETCGAMFLIPEFFMPPLPEGSVVVEEEAKDGPQSA